MARNEIMGFLTILAMGLACASSSSNPGKITAEELLEKLSSDEPPTILDVRSKREYASAHVPGAIHIPFLEVQQRIGQIPSSKEQPLVVYCGHGPRAYWARRSLSKQGLNHVVLLKGHFRKWAKDEFPVEK